MKTNEAPEQYIPKSALVAEIERRININETCQKISGGHEFCRGAIDEAKEILSFLDTLEVKEQLTWQDIRLISEIGEDFMNSEESDNLSEEEYYTEILNRFKAQKGEEV